MAGPYLNAKLNSFISQLAADSKVGQAQVGVPGSPVGRFANLPTGSLNPHFNLTPDQIAGLKDSGVTNLSQAAQNPAILKILNDVESANARNGIQGGKVEDNTHRHGLLSRVFDVLQRPMYATAEGAKEAGEAAGTGKGIGDIASGFGRGALLGIEGKRKTDFGQVLQEIKDFHAAEKAKGINPHGSGDNAGRQQALDEAKANPGMGGRLGLLGSAAGFGLDVIGDPLTYSGVGLVDKSADVAKAVGLAKDTIETIKSSAKLSPESRDLISGAMYSEGKVSQKAAQASVPRVHEIAQKVAKAEGATTFDKTVGELAQSEISHEDLIKAAKLAAAKREAVVTKQILDNYNHVAETNIPHQLALKFAGGRLPIPGTDLLAATAKGAASKVNVVNKGMKAFNDKFVTKAGSFPELHSIKLSEFGQGMTMARLNGREIRRALNPLGKSGRTEALSAALHGHASNQLVKLPDGQTMDAAEWMRGRIVPVKASMDELGITPKDMNSWLPKHTQVNMSYIKNAKGKKIPNPNWLEDSMKTWPVKDGGQALWFLENSFQQAKAYKGMLHSMSSTFGAHLPEDASVGQKALYKSLQDKGWTQARKVPELKGHLFDGETAKYVSHIADMMKNDRNFSKFWSTLAHINHPIKFALTLPNPAFHWHNAIGDAFVNHLDNILPQHYSASARVLRKRNKFFETYNPAEHRYPLLSLEGNPLENARSVNPNFDKELLKNRHGLKSADGNVHDKLTEAELYAGYNHFGLRQNYAQELGFNDNSPVGHLKGLVDHITTASEAREDYFRLAHFIGLVDKNPGNAKTLQDAMEFAARRVRETHFDYTDFTKFEKEVMSQLIPFYKWSRKAFPLMMQIMFTNPGKAALVPKGLRAMAQLTGRTDMATNDTLPNLEDAVVPKWMRDSGYVPISTNFLGKGNPAFGYVANPFSDLFTQQLNGVNDGTPNLKQFLLGQLTPAIKTPVELAENQNSFTGGKVFNTDPGKPGIPSQLLQYLASQTPITNVANQTAKGNPGTLFSWATPLSTQVDTPARQKSELIRQRDVARAIARELKYKHRNDPNKPGKFAKLPTLK